ncbi:HTH CENPB-type domain-containing protein [Trichonephila clavipes]|nr:HTH CENPB-type domain-containing protein [Trichonephila clavipes]
MDQLKIWEEQIRRGGSTKDKYTTIDKLTHDSFVEARQSNQQVTTRNLQQWALAAASQFPDLEFKASEAWVKIFKRKHRIRQREITKFVSERETATMEETHAAAEKFRLHIRALIPNYDKDFVLNTDQTGCQYQSTYNRTLAEHKDRSDEAHFWLKGYVNKQNCRIWSEANPQVYVETPLHPEKLTVWCALWAGGILLQKR